MGAGEDPLTPMAPSEQFDVLAQGAVDVISRAELLEKLGRGGLRAKLGIDPTGTEIHLGFAVVLRKLRQFQDLGHTAVLIIGDFTAQVGDPSGRGSTRVRLAAGAVAENAASYVEQICRILDPDRLEIRRNSEWFDSLDVRGILGLTDATTVAQMLTRNDFRQRYEGGRPISLTEFMYPLFQALDSVMIDADVELGGTDQLFNLHMGRDLQIARGHAAQVVITTPLLVGIDGGSEIQADGSRLPNKMSKSMGNTVGIAESPDQQFGKLMSMPDDVAGDSSPTARIERYLQYATGWGQEQIDTHLAALRSGELHPNAAKRAMARAVCDLYHGPGAGDSAEAEFDRRFAKGGLGEPSEIATFVVSDGLCDDHGRVRLARVIAAAGLAKSAKEAERLIRQGGVRLDGAPVTGTDARPAAELDGVTLNVGKLGWARLSWSERISR
jgi:tyrosyl-tRNA synthetase